MQIALLIATPGTIADRDSLQISGDAAVPTALHPLSPPQNVTDRRDPKDKLENGYVGPTMASREEHRR